MKTKSLLCLVAATVLTAVTFNFAANGALLSPRAAGNQIKIVASTPSAAPTVAVAAPTQVLSPRAAGNAIVHTQGTSLASVKCAAIGTPKYAAMLGNNARTTCCDLTLAECPMMHGCAK
jgi:hypothetical protein